LFNDALHFAISMSLKFRKEIKIPTFKDNLMEKDLNVIVVFLLLISNNKKGVYDVLDSFLRKYGKKPIICSP
jgi:hypothetical protein